MVLLGMVLGAIAEAGRAPIGRVIIGAARGAAKARDAVKITAAMGIRKNVRFVFIDNWGFK
jgi:hypothetical protein